MFDDFDERAARPIVELVDSEIDDPSAVDIPRP
jgi:hypothetical protein